MTATRTFGIRIVCALALALPATADAATLIHAGRLIDGRSDTVRTVGHHRGRRRSHRPHRRRLRDAGAGRHGDRSEDGDGHAGADGHARPHLQRAVRRGRVRRALLPQPADVALRATTYARKTLLAGFTTVRDCGAGDKLNLAMRDAVEKGWVVGPRIVAAGSVTTTGGHGDGTNGLATELQEALAPRLPGTANGPDEMRAGVRQRYKDGADFIKIAATGGVLSLAKSGQAPLFTDEPSWRPSSRRRATTG